MYSQASVLPFTQRRTRTCFSLSWPYTLNTSQGWTSIIGICVSDALEVDAVFLGVCERVCALKRLLSGISVVNVLQLWMRNKITEVFLMWTKSTVFPPCTVIEMISSLYLYITSYYKLSSLEECEIFTAYLYNCRFYTCGQKEITLFCPVSSVHSGRINGNLADMISDILLQLNAWCPGVTSVPTVAWKQYFCRIKTFQPHMIVWKLALVC